jgi:hypothetical protein
MRIRHSFLALVVLALSAGSLAGQGLTATITARENAIWQTIKDKHFRSFESMLSPQFRGVYDDGVHTRAAEVAVIRDVNLTSFHLSDVQVRSAGPGVAVMTYHVEERGDYKGQDFSGGYNCSSVWRHEGGRWVGILHSEVKAR